jgi:hypothetical protein
MLRQIQLFLFIALSSVSIVSAQVGQGGIQGKVLDKANNEPIPFANIVVELNGNQVAGATTDFDGKYTIKPLAPGKYDIKASFVGYQQIQMTGVVVNADKLTFLTISMSQGIELKTFEKVEYDVPLINKDQTTSGGTVTREEIAKMPGRSAEMAALTVGGIYSADGERGNVRGAREEATDTYIDGVKVRGSTNIPNQAIEQVNVMLGGLPAQYGDATGGVISITLRSSSLNYWGSTEVVSSQITDPYNFNLLGYTLSGPLITGRDKNDPERKVSKIGFFLSGELQAEKDPRPSYVGSWKVRDDRMEYIKNNPSRAVGAGFFPEADFTRMEHLEPIRARQNVASQQGNLMTKFDINTSENTSLTIGGTFSQVYGRSSTSARVYNNTLFNSENNPAVMSRTWRVYSNFTHRFGGSSMSEESASIFKNAYYSLQVDYSRFDQTIQDPTHRDNFFNYGHIGAFTSEFIPTYEFREDESGLVGYFHNGFRQLTYDFDGSNSSNPILANYTQNYYDLFPNPAGRWENPQQVIEGGALLNGRFPLNRGQGQVSEMWNAPGIPHNVFSNRQEGQFRVRATGSADIKNHNILFGFEYEQRSDRLFQVSPYGLWEQMRLLTNKHIEQLDVENPNIDYFSSSFPVINYNRRNASPGEYDASDGEEAQSFFDYNVRKKLGLDTDGIEWIDINTFNPDMFRLDFFSANELLNDGSNFVTYYGFNHAGKRLRKNPSFNDFFTDRDDYGNLKREIPAFQPIYMAGYIQDKFAFDDLIFNVGVRVDRFDANQPVLRDPYSLFATKKAGEINAAGYERPANIGDDFVVYVNDINTINIEDAGTNIVGFRSGDTWFNSEGVQITDARVLETPTGIAPWLVDPSRNVTSRDLSIEAFRDYTPQINIMPRIAFSFPISDDALFFAHYDVLTKRPGGDGLRLNPLDYLFILQRTGQVLNNPNLRPEKTITYELGFQQRLTQSSSLKLAAFYNEMRDMVTVIPVNQSYPRNYMTFGNIDFGTVKGMTLAYDLRRTGNISMKSTYTLQFANGTGSTATTSVNLINQGFGNLRTAQPLNFDQRHAFTTSLDFRFDKGKNYNGPILFDSQILANTGLNILALGGSGTPYTQQHNVVPEALTASGIRAMTKGSLNGSRIPWSFRVNLRLDKDFDLAFGKDEEKKKIYNLNLYVWIQNALNNQNILNVYRATGSPTDDGYLNAPEFQAAIQQQNDEQAYREMYMIKVMNPFNFSMPRTVRLGAIFSF